MPEMPIQNFLPNWGGEPDEEDEPSEDEMKLKRSKMVAVLLGATKSTETRKSTLRPRKK